MLLNQFPFGQVASWLAQGTVIPFLGAAASRVGVDGPTQLPDGPGLATELVGKMELAYPGTPSDDLAKVAQYFEQTVFDRPALYDYLHDRFYQQQVSAPLARVARLLAAMPDRGVPRFVVTTNYDVLVERAFRDAERPLCVITQNMRDPEHGAGRVSLTLDNGSVEHHNAATFQWDEPRFPAGTTYLFKMHGSAHRKVVDGRDDLIITENDYVDFLVNAGGPISPFFPPASLAAAFKTKRFLFLGYSLKDWNFRAFLRLLVLRNALSGKDRLRHWAIQRAPNELDVQLWSQRNVNVYGGDLSEFCDRLEAGWTPELTQ